jgi:protein gp37
MSDSSKIEWTDATWNPVTGCTKVSPGCDHCYAETFAERWRGTPGHHFEQGFDVTLRPERITQPLRWKKPRRVFVNSMSDLFHEAIPDEYIATVFGVMAQTPQHTYQVLTKRHGRMRSLLNSEMLSSRFPFIWPLPNVWLGVSVEDQKWADIRIPALLGTPAVVRFISAEPLLGPIDLHAHDDGLNHWLPDFGPVYDSPDEPMCQAHGWPGCPHVQPWAGCAYLDWVILGGESGRGARPVNPAWVQSIVEQCQEAGTAVFVKQLGSVEGRSLGAGPKGGDWNHWPFDLRVREFPRMTDDRRVAS